MSALNIAYAGIQSANLGHSTTTHNISNANTDGYSRQVNHQRAAIALGTGSGFFGQGSQVTTVRRAYDEFLNKQVNDAQSRYSYSQEYADLLARIDNSLADPTTGLTPVLQEFFQSVQDVADNPDVAATRQALVTGTQTMITRYQSLQQTVDELEVEVDGQIKNSVEEINAICKEIGALNNKITIAEGTTRQPANDLQDQRDLLINKLSEQIAITTLTDNKGRISVFTGSGQRLVSEVGEVTELSAEPSSNGSGRLSVHIVTPGEKNMELPDRLVTGGKLGGLIAFRQELDIATNELGRVAASMALVINAQHAQGQDLLNNSNYLTGAQHDTPNDNFVANFFVMEDMQPKVTNYNTNSKGADNDYAAVLNATFTNPEHGPLVTDGNFYTMLTTHNYTLEVTDATAGAEKYKLIDEATGQEVKTDLTFNNNKLELKEYGFELEFDANKKTVAVGDKFYIQPTANAVNGLKIDPAIAADHNLIATALPFDTSKSSSNKGSGEITQAKSTYNPNGTPLPVFSKEIFYNADTKLYTSEIQLSFVEPNLKIQKQTTDANGNKALVELDAGTEIYYREAGKNEETKITVEAGKIPEIPYSQNITIAIGGMSFSISGQPNENDTFIVKNTDGARSDSRNILAIGELQTKNTVAGISVRNDDSTEDRGTTTLQGAYSEMVALIGSRAKEMNISAETQSTVLLNAEENKQSLVGVNLDEEYVNMIKYQQAYQAAAKCIETSQIMFDSVIAAV